MKIIGPCTRCGQDMVVEIGEVTVEEAEEKLRALGVFICPAHNLKLCPSYPCTWSPHEWKILQEGSEKGVSD